MQFKHLNQTAIEVQQCYREQNRLNGLQSWTTAEYLQGFLGDVGDLAKLVMARHRFRHISGAQSADYSQKLAHELSDCLWSLLVIAHELNIDLEQAFITTMAELQQRTNSQT